MSHEAFETVCPVCGSNPCMGICPEADPFHGDQQAEALWHDAQNDYLSEAFGDEARLADQHADYEEQRAEEEYEAQQADPLRAVCRSFNHYGDQDCRLPSDEDNIPF